VDHRIIKSSGKSYDEYLAEAGYEKSRTGNGWIIIKKIKEKKDFRKIKPKI
jgi:hypothetical protein